MSKKFFIVLLALAVMSSPLFAQAVATTDTTSATLNLSFIKTAVNLVVGVFAGGYVLIKAAMDIFGAVRHSDQDPNALKKAIGSLVLHIAVLASFMFVINYVFSGMAPTSGSADNFFTGLTGAFVSI